VFPLAERVYQVALKVLRDGKLHETKNFAGGHYRIVDALTPPGGTIDARQSNRGFQP
jgi:hypothetical protein